MRHAICTMRKIYDGIVCVRIFLVIRVLIFSSSSFEIAGATMANLQLSTIQYSLTGNDH